GAPLNRRDGLASTQCSITHNLVRSIFRQHRRQPDPRLETQAVPLANPGQDRDSALHRRMGQNPSVGISLVCIGITTDIAGSGSVHVPRYMLLQIYRLPMIGDIGQQWNAVEPDLAVTLRRHSPPNEAGAKQHLADWNGGLNVDALIVLGPFRRPDLSAGRTDAVPEDTAILTQGEIPYVRRIMRHR